MPHNRHPISIRPSPHWIKKAIKEKLSIWTSSSLMVASVRAPVKVRRAIDLWIYVKILTKYLSTHQAKTIRGSWIEIGYAIDSIEPLFDKNHRQVWDDAVQLRLIHRLNGKVCGTSPKRAFRIAMEAMGIKSKASDPLARLCFATAHLSQVRVDLLAGYKHVWSRRQRRAHAAVIIMQSYNARGDEWSQEKFTELLGISVSTLRRYQSIGNDNVIYRYATLAGSPVVPEWKNRLPSRMRDIKENGAYLPDPHHKNFKIVQKRIHHLNRNCGGRFFLARCAPRTYGKDRREKQESQAEWRIAIRYTSLHRHHSKAMHIKVRFDNSSTHWGRLTKLDSCKAIRKNAKQYDWDQDKILRTIDRYRDRAARARIIEFERQAVLYPTGTAYWKDLRRVKVSPHTYSGSARAQQNCSQLSLAQKGRKATRTGKKIVLLRRPLKQVKRYIWQGRHEVEHNGITIDVCHVNIQEPIMATRIADAIKVDKLRYKQMILRHFVKGPRQAKFCSHCGWSVPNQPHPEYYKKCGCCGRVFIPYDAYVMGEMPEGMAIQSRRRISGIYPTA